MKYFVGCSNIADSSRLLNKFVYKLGHTDELERTKRKERKVTMSNGDEYIFLGQSVRYVHNEKVIPGVLFEDMIDLYDPVNGNKTFNKVREEYLNNLK